MSGLLVRVFMFVMSFMILNLVTLSASPSTMKLLYNVPRRKRR